MISGAQRRAARALAQISAEQLARGAAVDLAVVREFERKISRPSNEVVSKIEGILEALGVVFIPENGGGVGVRLKFSTSDARRIGILEGEGGMVASDDVP
jgi:transcriptional regulator with XRE-family HTH domain